MGSLRVLLVLFACLSPASGSAETRLLMAEEVGCFWCARWNAEIAEIYPKTEEGKAAPLTRFDIREGAPEGITFSYAVRYTPTFVLVVDGTEVGRIEGYPGEDFFWGLLASLLSDARQTSDKTG